MTGDHSLKRRAQQHAGNSGGGGLRSLGFGVWVLGFPGIMVQSASRGFEICGCGGSRAVEVSAVKGF